MMTAQQSVSRCLQRVSAMVLAATLMACQHTPHASEPAHLLISPSHTACLLQIESIMARDLGGEVELTQAAFAQSDRLSLGAADLLDAQGRPLQGRQRGQPESYRLSKTPSGCQIQRENHAGLNTLDACQCKAVAKP